jgi:NAD(P)-dependent dehydrogenase (short-subunit alcohol dehydrogenase family)
MDLYLKGKVALVSGGTSGIGRKICHTYAQEGAHPVILGLNEEKGEKVLKECEEFGVEALFFRGDCSQEEVCQKAVAETVNRFGRVDILVHGAAPYTDGSAVMPFLKQTQKIWEDFVNVILWGSIYLTKAVLPHMFEHEYGRLIYICSDAGRAGDAYQAVYAACKTGLVGFMKSMAHYGGRKNVLANVVSPALTITDENEKLLNEAYKYNTKEGREKITKAYATGRLATAQDVANMVVFLTSDRASDVTGQVIGVNGGFFMPSI